MMSRERLMIKKCDCPNLIYTPLNIHPVDNKMVNVIDRRPDLSCRDNRMKLFDGLLTVME